MANTQPMKTRKERALQAGTSGGLTLPLGKASTDSAESPSLSKPTTATMLNASQKIWTNAALEVLRSKAGLVAGALADWQAAGGLVVVKNVKISETMSYPKIYLVADGLSIYIRHSVDGVEFDLVAGE